MGERAISRLGGSFLSCLLHMIPSRSDHLVYEPLGAEHVLPLHASLADARVYEYIGARSPTVESLTVEFARRAAGPPPGRSGEQWVNLAVALASAVGTPTDVFIGRLEATLHGTWGEVAYLFGPAYWGRGYATEAMTWFHGMLIELGTRELWAAVAPSNVRSLALLRRLGYREVSASASILVSHDPGDVCLRRKFERRVLVGHLPRL